MKMSHSQKRHSNSNCIFTDQKSFKIQEARLIVVLKGDNKTNP